MEKTSQTGDLSVDLQKTQLEIARKQLYFTRITAVCTVTILVLLVAASFLLLPKINQSLHNINEITEEFSKEDIGQMIQDIDAVTRTSQEGMEQAIERLNQVDLESLNQAIQSLNSILKPLKNLMN